MRKIAIVLLLLSILTATLAAVGYVHLQQQLIQQQQDLNALQQDYAQLNDNLVALQREPIAAAAQSPSASTDNNSVATTNAPTAAAPTTSPTTAPIAAARAQSKAAQAIQSRTAQSRLDALLAENLHNSKALLRSQLQLLQLSLAQKQYSAAMTQLNDARATLGKLHLAAPLQASLQQSLAMDESMILQQFKQHQQQQNTLLNLLNAIEKDAQQALQQTPQRPVAQAWWQRWLQITPASTSEPLLLQRAQRYQLLQWRLQMAQQALLYGYANVYVQQLDAASLLLQPLPDAKSKNILAQVHKLQHMPQSNQPQLQTLALLR